MQWLQLDLDLPAGQRPATPPDQPDARRAHDHRSAHDSVELQVGEQEHALDEVVIGGTRSAQDESEDRAEHNIDRGHHSPAIGKIMRYTICVVTMPGAMNVTVVIRLGRSKFASPNMP